jgi:hypothetical protein
MQKTIPTLLSPVVSLAIAASLYAILWPYEPYNPVGMFTDYHIAIRNRIFAAYSVAFALVGVAAIWLAAYAWRGPLHAAHVIAGILALWPIAVLVTAPLHLFSDGAAVLTTIGVVCAGAVTTIWGSRARRWQVPLCITMLLAVFAGIGYVFAVDVIINMFRD